jgi:hypothetical protein
MKDQDRASVVEVDVSARFFSIQEFVAEGIFISQ